MSNITKGLTIYERIAKAILLLCHQLKMVATAVQTDRLEHYQVCLWKQKQWQHLYEDFKISVRK